MSTRDNGTLPGRLASHILSEFAPPSSRHHSLQGTYHCDSFRRPSEAFSKPFRSALSNHLLAFCRIRTHAVSIPIHHAKVVLGYGIAFGCSASNPRDRFTLIFRHSFPFHKKDSKVVHCRVVFPLGGLSIPLRCLLQVSCDSPALIVHQPEIILSRSVSLCRSTTEPIERLCFAPGHPPAFPEGHSQIVLRSRVALERGLPE